MDNYKDKLIEILDKVGVMDWFDENEDGSFSTTVHTGKIIEAFKVKIIVDSHIVKITTETFLGAGNRKKEYVQPLFESINKMCKRGKFFVNEKNILAFFTSITLEELEELSRPFGAVFYGCDVFEKYQDTILKSLTGQQVFFMNMGA